MIARMTKKIGYLRRYFKRNAFVFGENRTPKKIFNFFLMELQDYFNIPSVYGKPYTIFLDPVNICPLKCPLCPTGMDIVSREKKLLEMEKFKEYLRDLKSTLYLLKFYNYGEPFLHPLLPEMIAYAKQFKMDTQVNTNLNVMKDGYAEKIVASGLDRIVVSFDGLKQSSYASYRKAGKAEKVMHYIDVINEAKRKKDSATPHIVLQFLITRHNEHEMKDMQKYADSVNAEFYPQPITFDITNKQHREDWMPVNDAYSLYDREKLIKKKTEPDKKCGFLWNDPVINVDGGVAPCCHLYYKSTDYGNLNENSFGEIWNNKMFRTARNIFRNKRVNSKDTPCERCVHQEGFTDQNVDLINESQTNLLK